MVTANIVWFVWEVWKAIGSERAWVDERHECEGELTFTPRSERIGGIFLISQLLANSRESSFLAFVTFTLQILFISCSHLLQSTIHMQPWMDLNKYVSP